MNRSAMFLITLLSLCAANAAAKENSERRSAVASTPQWEKIKSLVGEWEGHTMAAGKKIPARISIRMTADGSAVMHWMDAGGPHEMITMFHMDKAELLATHYCAAHNQPRFRAISSKDPARIDFEFKDGTNIRPGDGYMKQLTVTFVDSDHHNEAWGFDDGGKVETVIFYLTRVKK